jgi:hypothetical protein
MPGSSKYYGAANLFRAIEHPLVFDGPMTFRPVNQCTVYCRPLTSMCCPSWDKCRGSECVRGIQVLTNVAADDLSWRFVLSIRSANTSNGYISFRQVSILGFRFRISYLHSIPFSTKDPA